MDKGGQSPRGNAAAHHRFMGCDLHFGRIRFSIYPFLETSTANSLEFPGDLFTLLGKIRQSFFALRRPKNPIISGSLQKNQVGQGIPLQSAMENFSAMKKTEDLVRFNTAANGHFQT